MINLNKIQPLNDYVVLKYKKEENVTKSGIITGIDKNKKQESIGIVYNFGPKVKDLKKDDNVVYKNYSGTQFKINEEEEYLIIKYEDILAIINK
ncbi:MAG: molecular chaperonin small subunit [Candidatus Phytoplasma cynodontis]|nr:MAG: molecular chaperonin small subunit [Candidatus Phytoplasma cynodontis]